jgi:hypothetical protein
MVCTLIFSCTNTETETSTNTTTIVADQSEENLAVGIEQETEEVEEEVEAIEIEAPEKPVVENKVIQTKEKTVVENKSTRTKVVTNSKKSYSSSIVAVGTIALNTVFMTEEEVAQFNEEDNSNLANIEFELPSADAVAALRDMLDDLVDEVEGFATTEDTTTEIKVKTGAFNEVISATKSGEDITDEIIFKDANSMNKESLEYMRRPKPLVDYSGYKIELMTVYNKSLNLDDPLFKTFGGLLFKNNTTNSITYYLGNFKDTDALDDYLQKVIKTRFPKAKGVKFEKGLEVKYN